MTIVPNSTGNVSDNFAGFSDRRSVTPEQFFSSLDQGDKHHLQVEQCLLDHPLVTDGATKTLAAVKSIGSGWGHISMSDEVKTLLCEATTHAPETIRKHLAALVHLTLLLKYVKVDGEEIIIHAGPHKLQREQAYKHLAEERWKDLAEREAIDKRLAAERARKAASRKARAEMKAKQRGNQTPPEPPFSGPGPGTSEPNFAHAEAESAARESQESGTDVPSPSMCVRPSYTNGDTNEDTTTTPIPGDSPVVEESARDAEAERRKREDAQAGEVVVVFPATLAGEEQEEEQEQTDGKEAQKEDAGEGEEFQDDPIGEDPSADEPVSKPSPPSGGPAGTNDVDTPVPVRGATAQALNGLDDQQKDAALWLLGKGVSRADAVGFVCTDLAQVQRQREWFPYQQIKDNVGGFLFKAILDGWSAPKGFLSVEAKKQEALTAQERKAKSRAEADERALRAEQLNAATEDAIATLKVDHPAEYVAIVAQAKGDVPLYMRGRRSGDRREVDGIKALVRERLQGQA